jgi:hypothetical protein
VRPGISIIPFLRGRAKIALTLCWLGYLCGGCGGRQTVRERRTDELPLGLYEVADRTCENPLKVTEACSTIQYIELVQGTFHGVAKDQIAFVVWDAPVREAQSYTYDAGPLRGHFVTAREYVINELPDAKEWLVADQGTIQEYWLVRFQTEDRASVLVRMHLTLKAVARTPELDRRLRRGEAD